MLSHVAELHGHQKLQIGATWIHTYILWVLPLYTVLLPIENIALPWRPRWYCSPSSKTMTAFIHSCANIVLGTAKCWGYTHENGKHNSNNNNDIAAKQPHWTGTLRQHRILHHLDFSKILWGGYNLLFYRYEILGPKAMFLLSHSRVA